MRAPSGGGAPATQAARHLELGRCARSPIERRPQRSRVRRAHLGASGRAGEEPGRPPPRRRDDDRRVGEAGRDLGRELAPGDPDPRGRPAPGRRRSAPVELELGSGAAEAALDAVDVQEGEARAGVLDPRREAFRGSSRASWAERSQGSSRARATSLGQRARAWGRVRPARTPASRARRWRRAPGRRCRCRGRRHASRASSGSLRSRAAMGKRGTATQATRVDDMSGRLRTPV